MVEPQYTFSLDASRYDQEQIRLMEERLILLSNDDEPIGEGSKKDCHLIPPNGQRSPLHRAFSVFLFHPETGHLLLQKRADEKITFPGLWTNTCCSHPLTVADEREEAKQVGVRRAAARKLTHELGIPHDYDLDRFAYLTRIHYYAPSDDIWAEHEIDYILFLCLDAKVAPNPNEVSDTKWVSPDDLRAFFDNKDNKFTPWFRLIAESFLYPWWDKLLATRKAQGSPLDARDILPEVESRSAEMGSIIRM